MAPRTHSLSMAVVGHYLLTPVGVSGEETCASIRAGLNRFCEHPYYVPLMADPEVDEPEPLIGSFVPGLDPFEDAPERMLQMASGTLRGLLEVTGFKRAELSRCGLAVVLPEPDRAVRPWALEQRFTPALLARTGLAGFGKMVTACDGGAGMLGILAMVQEWFSARQVDRCVVLGVDSHFELERLKHLDEAHRLKSARGVDGFIPSECASALLLETVDRQPGVVRTPVLHLLGLGAGREPRSILSDEASTAAGLCEAIRGALAAVPQERAVRWVVSDLNGESYRAAELGLARARLGERLGTPFALNHPADCVGEVGAAVGGVLLACAAQAFARGYAEDHTALLLGASDSGARCAVLVGDPKGA